MKALERLDPNHLAALTVLAGNPHIRPGRDPGAALRKALGGDELVTGSVTGANELLNVGSVLTAIDWKNHASNEGIVIPASGTRMELLVRLGRAREVRTVVAVHESSARPPKWHWPLRIGFLPGAEPMAQRLERHTHWLSDNVDIVVLGRDGAECDIAVAVGSSAVAAYQRSVGVRAEMFLLFGKSITTTTAQLAANGAKALDASASATVTGAPARGIDFLEALVVELSHAKELPAAMHGAAIRTDRRALLEASSDLIAASDLRRQVPTLARRARHRSAARSTVTVNRGGERSIGVTAGQPMALPEYADRMAEAAAADDLLYDSEDGAGAAIGAGSRAITRATPARRGPRFLQAQVFVKNSPAVRALAFHAGRHHIVAVRVGSASVDWMGSAKAFPTSGLFRKGVKSVDLDVALVVSDLGTVATGIITLARTGDSNVAELPLDVPAGTKEIRGLITVSHGGTVLQAAEIRGPCVRRKPSTDGTTTQITFDLKTVTSDGSLARLPETGKETTVTVVVGDDVAVVSGTPGVVKISTATTQLLAPLGGTTATTLRDAADPFAAAASRGSPMTEPAGVAALREVAKAGSHLRATFESAGIDLAPLRAADRIRLVMTNESPVLPLELIYDGGRVGDRAKPCASKIADCTCTGRPKVGVICLRQFWGLSKLIERHAPIAAAAASGRAPADPPKPRSTLAPFTSALFGATEKVPEADRKLISTRIRSLVGALEDAASWSAWRSKTPRRSLLIGVVHNEMIQAPLTALEIGNRKFLGLGDVDEQIVGRGRRATGPIVMLIGCKTALPDNPLVSFVTQLRAHGAAAVVGSLADIPVLRVEALVSALLQTISKQLEDNGSTTFAAALQAARGQLLSDGQLLGMALVAYGDAEWLLTKEAS